jgi:hypothetical protein
MPDAMLVGKCLNLLDSTASNVLRRLIVPGLGPIDGEAHNHQGSVRAVIKSQHVGITLADPVWKRRLQDEGPRHVLYVVLPDRYYRIMISLMRRGEIARSFLIVVVAHSCRPGGFSTLMSSTRTPVAPQP